jgi:DNA-directed RNA polymerase subunit RPC12/RpoP
MRITINGSGDRANDLRIAADLRRDLWAHSPVEVDPDNPLHGTHRDADGRAYIEFSTRYPDEVRRILREHGYENRVRLVEMHEPVGPACQNCGNIAGPVLPTVCPNCGFRDVSPCPACGNEVPRQHYTPLGGDLFRCPNCRSRVRFRFNSPMFLADGDYNQPLIVIDEAAAHHEVR